MSNKVLLKKSSVLGKAPAEGDLDYGELALNYADGLLYFKNASNNIQSFAAYNSATVTLTATQTLTNKTLTSPTLNTPSINGGSVLLANGTLVLPSASGASQTDSGSAVYDTSIGTLTIGTGSGRKTLVELTASQTLTNKTLTAPSIGNAVLTGTLSAGGGVGTNGQYLQSTATGVRWNTITADVTQTGVETLTNKTLTSPTIAGGALSGTFSGAITLSDTTVSTTTATGALKVAGGVGIAGSAYIGNRLGYVNASNVSVVYQYYNSATNSLDTVFG